jgi:hypothetical protein
MGHPAPWAAMDRRLEVGQRAVWAWQPPGTGQMNAAQHSTAQAQRSAAQRSDTHSEHSQLAEVGGKAADGLGTCSLAQLPPHVTLCCGAQQACHAVLDLKRANRALVMLTSLLHIVLHYAQD